MAARRGMADLAALLLQLGIDHRVEDGNGMTALHLAAWLNEDAVVSVLLDGTRGQPWGGSDQSIEPVAQTRRRRSKFLALLPAAAGPAANNAPCAYAETVHALASDARVRPQNVAAQASAPGPYSHAVAL